MNKSDIEIQQMQDAIINALPTKPSYTHIRDLVSRTGYKERAIRAMISEMRRDGVPICSSTRDGYWMASSSNEVEGLIHFYKSYIKNMQRTVTRLEGKRLEMLNKENTQHKDLNGINDEF